MQNEKLTLIFFYDASLLHLTKNHHKRKNTINIIMLITAENLENVFFIQTGLPHL